MRPDLNGATLGGTSNRVVGVLNAVGGSVTGTLDIVSNAVLNLSGTYVYGPTVIKGNGTMNWFGGRFAPGSSLVVEPNVSSVPAMPDNPTRTFATPPHPGTADTLLLRWVGMCPRPIAPSRL